MTYYRYLKEKFKTLVDSKLWFLVAIVGTIQQTLKNMSPVLIWKDSDGDWINKRRNLTIFSPTLSVESYKNIKLRVDDLWLHQYDISSNKVIFDIGAGIGDDLVYLSRTCSEDAKLYAIEAHPITYRCLEKTILANSLTNVISINVACCDVEKTLSISSSTKEHLGNNIFENSDDCIEVRGVPLDSLVKEYEIDNIDFIKMNIEGAEYEALLGSRETINSSAHFVVSCHDFKYLESNEEYFRTFEKTTKLFKSNNRNVYARSNDPRREVPFYLYTS